MDDLDPKYKRENWKIPEAYFESLEDKILDRIKVKPPATRLFFTGWGKPMAIAASIALLTMIVILSYRSARAGENEISFNDLDSIDIVNFENSEEFNDEEFEEFVPEAVVDSLYKEKVLVHKASTFISNEELEDLQEEYSILDDEIEI